METISCRKNIIKKHSKNMANIQCENVENEQIKTTAYQETAFLEMYWKEKNASYVCEQCNFTCSKKSNFQVHLNTNKHKNKNTRENNCNICNKVFATNSGLWKHRQKCVIPSIEQLTEPNSSYINETTVCETQGTMNITNNIPMNLILEVIKQSKEIQNVLIEQNKELQTKLLEKENKLLEQNEEHHKQLVELAKKPSMVNSNNQFNLNFFLNETCKNAMNIQDFINSIKLTTQDFETTGRIGFVDGISRIFINELKRLEVERRPLHCTDMKRETVYVKDNDTWEKENQEKKKLKWAINSIAQLNLNQVQQWQQEYLSLIHI